MQRYKRLVFGFFLFAGLAASAQNVQYIYADTIFAGKIEVEWDLIREKLEERDLPDDIIDGIISYQKRKHAQNRSIKSRTVYLSEDSCFIELNLHSPYKNISYPGANPRLMMLDGRIYIQDSRSKEYFKSRIEDSTANFTATGRTKKILGFDCREYRSLNNVYTVWTTTLLPSAINPGIEQLNLPGAIIGVEIDMFNGIEKIEMVRIETKLN